MRTARWFLGVGGLILTAYGAAFLVAPGLPEDLVGLSLAGPSALTEIRSFYGGLELGMVAFLFLCAYRPGLTRPGLLFCGCAFGFAGAARFLGVARYGFSGPSQPVVAGLEVVYAAAAVWLLRRRARGA